VKFLKRLLPFASLALGATPLAPLLPVINAILPTGTDLGPDTTGQQAIDLISRQSAEVQAKLDAELGLEHEHTEQLRVLAEMDGPGSSTRPMIARVCILTMSSVTLITVSAIFIALWTEGLEHASGVLQLGLGIASMLSIFSVPVNKYIGVRSSEKAMRMAVAAGGTPDQIPGFGGLISSIFGGRKP